MAVLACRSNSLSNLKNPTALRSMYWDRNLSIGEIARITSTSKGHVHYYMIKFGIDRRPWTGLTPKVDPKLLLSTYRDQGKTLAEVSDIFRLSKSTVRDQIAKFEPLRPRSVPKYGRTPFSGSEVERAYLLGYRAGDLNAFQDSALTVTARVSTTHAAMLEMFEKTFATYGHCAAVPREVFLTGHDWQVHGYLDNSFRFLLPKPISPPTQIEFLYPFIAGLSDSDGCWFACAKGRWTAVGFNITSGNHELLAKLASVLEKAGYNPHVYLSRKKGTTKLVKGRSETKTITLKHDTWVLAISRIEAVKRLASNVLPYSRHREKKAKMELILDEKNYDWAVMGPVWKELRGNIRAETEETIRKAEMEYKARHGELGSGVVG